MRPHQPVPGGPGKSVEPAEAGEPRARQGAEASRPVPWAARHSHGLSRGISDTAWQLSLWDTAWDVFLGGGAGRGPASRPGPPTGLPGRSGSKSRQTGGPREGWVLTVPRHRQAWLGTP